MDDAKLEPRVQPENDNRTAAESNLPKTQQKSSFLTIFLSILLLISLAAAGFFAWQVQNLKSEVTNLEKQPIFKPEAYPSTTPSYTPDGV